MLQRLARQVVPLAALSLVPVPLFAQQQYPDEAVLQKVLGKSALRFPDEGVVHFYWWRNDVPIEWQGRPVEIFEGRSLRLSVRRENEECLGSGRWLVFGDEALPVVTAMTSGGLRVASLVPRFPGARPQAYEIRFFGRGSEQEIGDAVARAHDALEAVRKQDVEPPATLPTSDADGGSHVSEQPLEELFGCKAEVKSGVVLFRLPGPRGLDGAPAGRRMGIAVFAAFAGDDDSARVRLDWAMRPHEIPSILQELGKQGFFLESVVAAAPGLDDDLSQVAMVAKGPALELGRVIRKELHAVDVEPTPVDAAFTAPKSPGVLGIANGALADGVKSEATLPAGPNRARWTVTNGDDGQPIASMVDPGDIDSHSFNLLWTGKTRFRDGSITLRMRADRGRIDQGGGPIWRVRDADNYYICRFNPLEQDFRVYRVKDGVREQIQAIGGLPFRSGDWFTIRVDQDGDKIRCTLNGKVVLTVHDDTFPDAGGVGVWSKADSQCSVAGLWAEATDGDTSK